MLSSNECPVVKAIVDWIAKGDGGRVAPPVPVIGVRPYTTVMRFVDEPWPGEIAWSLVVIREAARKDNMRWLADVHFLVNEAPHSGLKEERQFELYEGWKRVACGKIISPSEADSCLASMRDA